VSDKPNVDPRDSFGGRLKRALNVEKPAAPSPPPSNPPPNPKDSFANRLAGAIDSNKGGDDFAKDSHAGAASNPVDTASTTPPTAVREVLPVDRPVGVGEVVARVGDCIISLASAAGHFWQTLWDDPANAELRELRKDPCILLAGDRVHIPPLRQKQEPGNTEKRHRFRRKGEPEIFQVQILRDDEPRANQPYTLLIDDASQIYQGYTDAQGMIRHLIRPNAMQAILSVGTEGDMPQYIMRLGGLDPIDTTRGVQQRLNNLGFKCGEADGQIGPLTRAALRKFQRSRKLPASGAPDEATRKELISQYGC